jgi:hypothetical protein
VRPLLVGNRIDYRLLSVFVLINGLVLANACLHDPTIGYDSQWYLRYIEALSKLHLVTPSDSAEFFSPPLPFTFPALLMTVTGMNVVQAAKYAQFVNVFLSIGLTWYLIKACKLIEPRPSLALGAMVFLGILPVYYKTFAFVRGEPYVAFFSVVILYYLVRMIVRREFSSANVTGLSLGMGLCALSRQWGILLFPAVYLVFFGCWIRLRAQRARIARAAFASLMITAVIGGWFYLYLRLSQGSFTAFAREPTEGFSFGNQPPEFYLGISRGSLFNNPVRPHFPNQFIPIFYSETWGDYWCYFSVSGRDTRTGAFLSGVPLANSVATGRYPSWLQTNYASMSSYLGRVNRVSLLPSALAVISLFALAASVIRSRGDSGAVPDRWTPRVFLLVGLAAIMAGYLWFLIMYPSIGKGATIKASYVLQIFPFLAVVVGLAMERVEARSPRLYFVILAVLALVFIHNLPAMVTHY